MASADLQWGYVYADRRDTRVHHTQVESWLVDEDKGHYLYLYKTGGEYRFGKVQHCWYFQVNGVTVATGWTDKDILSLYSSLYRHKDCWRFFVSDEDDDEEEEDW